MSSRSAPKSVLVVDDEADIRELVEMTLSRMGLTSEAASTLEKARRALASGTFDLCLTDMRLPDGDGLDLVEELANRPDAPPIAVITAYGDVETAVHTLKVGAFDFVAKPIKVDQLRTLVQQALQLGHPALGQTQTDQPSRNRPLIGDSRPMQQLREQLDKVRRSQAPIHINGESGTGKELVARAIHAESSRGNGPFVPVNCGAIPGTLIESELFGYVAGAFTGAVQDTDGLFAKASGGTLFLDEVAELNSATQVKLLRALQERAIRPVGGNVEKAVDIRVLSAAQTNLANEVSKGEFRPDLFYRLNVIELQVPPLRHRRDDLPPLADAILKRLAQRDGSRSVYRLGDEALSRLSRYHFPGNVRELENILERAVAMADDTLISEPDLGPLAGAASEPGPTDYASASGTNSTTEGSAPAHETANSDQPALNLVEELESLERKRIEQALAACRYNKTRAAEKLGISFRALRYRLAKLGID